MEQAISDSVIEILKAYGLAGLVILALGYFCLKLYNRNQELNDSLNELGKEAVQANLSVTNALNGMAEVNRQSNSSIQTLSGSLQSLDGSVRQALIMGSRSNGRRSGE